MSVPWDGPGGRQLAIAKVTRRGVWGRCDSVGTAMGTSRHLEGTSRGDQPPSAMDLPSPWILWTGVLCSRAGPPRTPFPKHRPSHPYGLPTDSTAIWTTLRFALRLTTRPGAELHSDDDDHKLIVFLYSSSTLWVCAQGAVLCKGLWSLWAGHARSSRAPAAPGAPMDNSVSLT